MSNAEGSGAASSSASTSAAPVITSFPLKPLTSTFTPPADCTGFYEEGIVFMVDPATSCLPSNFALEATAFFSPGIACPVGYVSACHDTTGVHSITTVTCCPTQGDVTLSCAGPRLAGVWTTLFCTWIAPSSTIIDITVSINGVTSTSAAFFTSPGGLNAYGVRMVYESTDVTSSTPSTASSTQSVNSGTSTSPPSFSPTSSSASTPSRISSGAKIAIGVVIPVLVLAILGAVFLWWRRRRQYGVVGKGPPVPAAELHDRYKTSELLVEANRSELPGQAEMGRGAQELHNSGMPVELPVERER